MKKSFIFLALPALLSGCSFGESPSASTGDIGENATSEYEEENAMKVEVNGHIFEAELYEGETAAAFASLLPLRLYMQELNGNEKYHYLSSPLPSEPEMVGTIRAGDIMLFDSSCVVLFYKSFDTPYSYTRIGRIKDPSGLKEAVGEGDCRVSFALN